MSRGTGPLTIGLLFLIALTSALFLNQDFEKATDHITGMATDTITETKLVFVSSQAYNGSLGNLAGADAKCQQLANAANIPSLSSGSTFKAWLSTDYFNAKDRLTHWSTNYILRDGTIVANGWSDLIDGTLDHAINIDEKGNACTGTEYDMRVWTGTGTDGVDKFTGIPDNSFDCSNWTTNATVISACFGMCNRADSGWTYYSCQHCNYKQRVYCFQESGTYTPATTTTTTSTMTTTSSTTTTTALPDLTVESIWSEGGTIKYTIRNIGGAVTGTAYNGACSTLYVDGVATRSNYLYPFGAGETRTGNFSSASIYNWYCSGTSDTIMVHADCDNSIRESNENNNDLTLTWPCPGVTTTIPVTTTTSTISSLRYTCLGGNQKIGDVNTDGKIDSKDLDILTGVWNGSISIDTQNICCGDTDNDGVIGMWDVLDLSNFIMYQPNGFVRGYSCYQKENCTDGIDNDDDGKIDASDTADCGVTTTTTTVTIPAPTTSTIANCHTVPKWDWSYCTSSCKCNAGEGDCDTDAECNTGYCAQNVGTNYGQSIDMDMCENRGVTTTTQSTTTTSGVSTTTLPTCTDSDGGENIYVRGTAKAGTQEIIDNCNLKVWNGYNYQYNLVTSCSGEDCYDNEAVCNPSYGGVVGLKLIVCPYGCQDGACISPKPDLTITDVKWMPITPKPGDIVKINVTLINIGTGASAPTTVIAVDQNGWGNTAVMISLQPGQTGIAIVALSAQDIHTTYNPHDFIVRVDPSNAIDELKEDNNNKSFSMIVSSKVYTCTGGNQRIGDVNNDGKIDSKDLDILTAVWNGSISIGTQNVCCGDVDNDGVIGMYDVLALSNFIMYQPNGFVRGYSCSQKENCNDGIDNDKDGKIDASDTDCGATTTTTTMDSKCIGFQYFEFETHKLSKNTYEITILNGNNDIEITYLLVDKQSLSISPQNIPAQTIATIKGTGFSTTKNVGDQFSYEVAIKFDTPNIEGKVDTAICHGIIVGTEATTTTIAPPPPANDELTASDLIGISMKLEAMKVSFNRMKAVSDIIARYYEGVGNTQQKEKFERISEMFSNGIEKIDSLEILINENIDNIEPVREEINDGVYELRAYLNEILLEIVS
ncbi:MAG: dockerin type I domain-containing protein [Candidatus Aenigmarchaeota archaeon]|nr:dockerin type I domain-containing protein [Candidatus Aenigmarchaeota archaeon]